MLPASPFSPVGLFGTCCELFWRRRSHILGTDSSGQFASCKNTWIAHLCKDQCRASTTLLRLRRQYNFSGGAKPCCAFPWSVAGASTKPRRRHRLLQQERNQTDGSLRPRSRGGGDGSIAILNERGAAQVGGIVLI